MSLDLNRRIRRPALDDDFLKSLTPEKGQEPAFATMADALVFLAAFAYYRNLRRRPFEKTAEPIPASVFINGGYDGFIDLLTADAAQDYEILSSNRTDERIEIFEELAAAGISELQDVIERERRSPVDVIRDLALDTFTEMRDAERPDFEQLLGKLEA